MSFHLGLPSDRVSQLPTTSQELKQKGDTLPMYNRAVSFCTQSTEDLSPHLLHREQMYKLLKQVRAQLWCKLVSAKAISLTHPICPSLGIATSDKPLANPCSQPASPVLCVPYTALSLL